jgi:hypothetical protein
MAHNLVTRKPAARSEQPDSPDLNDLLRHVIVVCALAGGGIHLAVLRQHLEYPLIMVGFALMGLAQWTFAAMLAVAPSARLRSAGLVLHAVIALTWAASRTVGLPFVPGAEQRAPVGTADVIANVASIAVIGLIVALIELDRRPDRVPLSRRRSRRILLVLAAAAAAATVAAVRAPHDHTQHQHHVPGGEPLPAAPDHDLDPVGVHEDHDHDHAHG